MVVVTMKRMSLAIAALGITAFVLGVIAENTKPSSGTPTISKGLVVCKYPSDPTPTLGSLSAALVAVAALFGISAIFYPYKGKSLPYNALFQGTTLMVFFHIAGWMTFLAEGMLVWATITENLHLTRNVHHNMDTKCPTAKTGLLGAGAFLGLNASLMWLICLMLADNAREDCFEEEEENRKGECGQVLTTDKV